MLGLCTSEKFLNAFMSHMSHLKNGHQILPKSTWLPWASHVALVVKNVTANADVRYAGLIPGSGRSPGEGNGDALQYSCLENPMDRGA